MGLSGVQFFIRSIYSYGCDLDALDTICECLGPTVPDQRLEYRRRIFGKIERIDIGHTSVVWTRLLKSVFFVFRLAFLHP